MTSYITTEIVAKAETVRQAALTRQCLTEESAEMVDLRRRAEVHASTLTPDGVIEFEKERIEVREGYNLPPVPFTDRGVHVLTSRGYTLDPDGSFTLG